MLEDTYSLDGARIVMKVAMVQNVCLDIRQKNISSAFIVLS